MININYNRLFNLHVAHNYYSDEHARGLNLQPTRETTQKLRNGNMLFKTIPHGITVLYRALTDALTDEDSPMVKLGPDLKLTFTLEAENKGEFLNVTSLDSPSKEYSSSSVLYFRNDPASASDDPDHPEEITHTLIDAIKNSLFTYHFYFSGSPATVSVKVKNAAGDFVTIGTKVDGTLLQEITVNRRDDDSYAAQIDLRDQPRGKYTIICKSGSTPQQEVIYVDDELAAQDILGIVDIIYDSNTVHEHIYGNSEQYKLQFSRKETIWKYFVVDKTHNVPFASDTLSIQDDITSGAVAFSRQGSQPHGSIKINGLDTAVFTSDNAIPFTEIPKSSLKLNNQTEGTTLLSHLPNPSLGDTAKENGSGTPESEIYVFI